MDGLTLLLYILYTSILLSVSGYIIKNYIKCCNPKIIPYILLVPSALIMTSIITIGMMKEEVSALVKLVYILICTIISSTSASGLYELIKRIKITKSSRMLNKSRRLATHKLYSTLPPGSKLPSKEVFTISISDTDNK